MLFWIEMVCVRLLIPDDDHARFTRQARDMSLSARLRAAATERLDRRPPPERFESRADVDRFFAECDTREDSSVEPDWDRHLAVIRESRSTHRP